MILLHLEYNEYGLLDLDSCYEEVDTSFVEQEDAYLKELVRSEPQ